MRIYLIAHKGKPHPFKMEAWARIHKIGNNGIYVETIHAFLKKKDARKWITIRGYKHLEIKIAEIIN